MDEEQPLEEKKPIKFGKPETFKVLKAFTLDKHYLKNSTFMSSDKRVIEKLLNEKYIK
jgi:hypothetical protein